MNPYSNKCIDCKVSAARAIVGAAVFETSFSSGKVELTTRGKWRRTTRRDARSARTRRDCVPFVATSFSTRKATSSPQSERSGQTSSGKMLPTSLPASQTFP